MELVRDRVSIITPCYNAENFIQRHIDIIINMTYQDIEFILINDGSTDKTEEIILANKERLEKRGIIFKYFTYPENRGQSYALNFGLKHFTGEFLCWTDCDDIMYPDSIARKVQFLKDNPRIGFCSSKAKYTAGPGVKDVKTREQDVYLKRSRIFWELIFGLCHPFCCIARSEAFLSVVPDREIATKYPMQNMQMFLPLAYNYEFGYIEEELFEYVVYKNSYSNSFRNKYIYLCQVYEIVDITLKKMDILPAEYLLAMYIMRIQKLRRLYYFLEEECIRLKTFFRLLFTYPQRRIFNRKRS